MDYEIVWTGKKGEVCKTEKDKFTEAEASAYARFLTVIEGTQHAIDKPQEKTA